MEFAWDENKRARNLRTHGLDFLDAEALFDGRPVLTYPSPRGESRFVSIGQLRAKFFAVVWHPRGGAVRLISFRRARRAEEKLYQNLFGKAD